MIDGPVVAVKIEAMMILNRRWQGQILLGTIDLNARHDTGWAIKGAIRHALIPQEIESCRINRIGYERIDTGIDVRTEITREKARYRA